MKIKDIGYILNIKPCNSDVELFKKINRNLKIPKKYKKVKKIKKIGNKGKEGDVYLSYNGKNKYAVKQFRKNKSGNRIEEEALLQQIAAKSGISPKVYGYNINDKNITMDLLDIPLLDIVASNDGLIPFRIQKQLVEIFKTLDKIGVFHGDPNPTNFMKKGHKIYIIDYGFSIPITPKVIKKHNTTSPNMKFMVLGLLCRLKELFGDKLRGAYYLESFLDKDGKKMLK